MYINITPLEVKKFEKENDVSFLSLFRPYNFANGVLLVSLIKRLSIEDAVRSLSGVIRDSSLVAFYEGVTKEFESQGYLTRSEEPTSEENSYATFGEAWDDGFVEAKELGFDTSDYWSLEPKVMLSLMERRIETKKAEAQKEIDLIHYDARIHAVNINAPDKAPKKPPQLFKSDDGQDEDEQAAALDALPIGGSGRKVDDYSEQEM